jgi:hypothetical protein
MKRRRVWFLVAVVVVAAGVVLYPRHESTYEFDGVNLRLRSCSRYRSWVLGVALFERAEGEADHPTAGRLRALGVLPKADEARARWVLIKGFKPGVSGWKGAGADYLRALGPTTWGTPVALPAGEDLSKNVWVRWAEADPKAAAEFWKTFQSAGVADYRHAQYLDLARTYLAGHEHPVAGADLQAFAERAYAY